MQSKVGARHPCSSISTGACVMSQSIVDADENCPGCRNRIFAKLPLPALTHHFVQRHRCGYGDVVRTDASVRHRNYSVKIAMFSGELAHARTFGAHHDAQWSFAIVAGNWLGLFAGVHGHGPDAMLFERFKRAHKIANFDDGQQFAGSSRGFGRNGGDGSCAVLWNDHAVRTDQVCSANHGAKITRVFDAIERNPQRGPAASCDRRANIVNICVFKRCEDRNHALMARIFASKRIELFAGCDADRDACCASLFGKLHDNVGG